jgi:predicted dehydrogenase
LWIHWQSTALPVLHAAFDLVLPAATVSEFQSQGMNTMKRNDATKPANAATSSRRDFLRHSGKLAAGSTLAGIALPRVHAGEDATIRLALIGCGGRGSGAVVNAFEAKESPAKLYTMADFFPDRLERAHKALSDRDPHRVDVPEDRRFVGFDSYRNAIDSLRPGDIAMLTGYAGWRPMQLEYAVSKGVHVFMEKSFATDVPGLRRVMAAGDEAKKKNLKIAAGLMCRHSKNRQELIRRIRDGALGQLHTIRAYRMQPVGPLRRKPPQEKELSWQIRNFVRFYWVSGGLWAEMDIHQIDEICWLKDAWPVTAHGIGGRAADSQDHSQNLDSFSVEWTFPDGTKAYDVVRYLRGCYNEFATYVHGSKCAAQFSGNIHAGTVHTYRDQRCADDNIDWIAPDEELTPWQAEWNVLLDAIQHDRPHNEARRAALSNLADIMGRAAVHSGKLITWEEALASNFQWCPNIEELDEDSDPPVKPDDEGRYPVPVPGKWTEL